MDPSKKLEFIHKMTKLGLEKVPHYAVGGPVAPMKEGVSNTTLGGPSSGGTVNNATNPNTGIIGNINAGLGLNNNFQGAAANILAGTNQGQLQQAYNQAQEGIGGLNNLAGITAGGVNQGAGAESALSAALADQAAGRGPNPAQAMLNQETGANVASTAALIAGARGAAANPGLAAEMAARQGAATQQQAVGQGATMEAQQQLAAQQNLANLSANQIAQGQGAAQTAASATQNEQNILQGANTSFNNAAVGMQSNINNVNSQTAAANQNMAANTVGGIMQGISSVSSLFAKGGLVRMDKGGNVLDAEHRNRLHKDSFALPGRRYPIHDESHARNALARVSQYGTPAEKSKVRKAVQARYPSIGVKRMAEGGDIEDSQPQIRDTSIAQVPQPGGFPSSPSEASAGPSIASTSSLPAAPSMASSGGGKSGGGGLSSIMGLVALMSEGGPVYKMAGGGMLGGPGINPAQSFVGQWVNSSPNVSAPNVQATSALPADQTNFADNVPKGKKKAPKEETTDQQVAGGPGDTEGMPDQPQRVSPGAELGNAPQETALAARGGSVKARDGKERAAVDGDSLTNDKIPAMLSEGEGVIDRETMNDPGPLGQMARGLIKHIEAKKKGGKRAAPQR